jgi:hypothetical protein
LSADPSNGNPLEPVTPDTIRRIPRDPFGGAMTFGAPVHEQLWNQRNEFPKLPSRVIIERADHRAAFAQGYLKDAAQLFKTWFILLPERVISVHNYGRLKQVYDTNKDYVKFLD